MLTFPQLPLQVKLSHFTTTAIKHGKNIETLGTLQALAKRHRRQRRSGTQDRKEHDMEDSHTINFRCTQISIALCSIVSCWYAPMESNVQFLGWD